MALNLYRSHRLDCKANHPEESRSAEFEERKKGWKRCDCPIFLSGTLSGKFRRQTTSQWEWPNAVADATKDFLAEQAETAAPATQKKYRLFLKRLAEFSDERGYTMIRQWDATDIRQFRSTWSVSAPPSSAACRC